MDFDPRALVPALVCMHLELFFALQNGSQFVSVVQFFDKLPDGSYVVREGRSLVALESIAWGAIHSLVRDGASMRILEPPPLTYERGN